MRACGIYLALCVAIPAAAVACAQDNCYNAFTHSLSIASPFCSTYIQITRTQTIILSGTQHAPSPTFAPPTLNAQLASRCNLDTNAAGVPLTPLSLRLSSACSCVIVGPRTVTVTVPAPTTNPNCPAPTHGAPALIHTVLTTQDRFQVFCGQKATDTAPPPGPISLPDPRIDTTYSFNSCIDSCDANPYCGLVNYIYDPVAHTYTCSYFYGTTDSGPTEPGGGYAAILPLANPGCQLPASGPLFVPTIYLEPATEDKYYVYCGLMATDLAPPPPPHVLPRPRIDTTYNFNSCINTCDVTPYCGLVNYIYDPVAHTYTCSFLYGATDYAPTQRGSGYAAFVSYGS